MTGNKILFISLIFVSFLTSCVSVEFGKMTADSRISLRVVSGSTKATGHAGNVLVRDIPAENGDCDGACFSLSVSDNLTCPLMDELDTKGNVMTTAGINTAGQQFTVDAYLAQMISNITDAPFAEEGDRSDFHFIKGRTVEYSGSKWNWDGSDDPLWRNGVSTTFWSYYPVATTGVRAITLPGMGGSTPTDAQQQSLSFNYSLPDPTGTDDAENQNNDDLLFAYNN